MRCNKLCSGNSTQYCGGTEASFASANRYAELIGVTDGMYHTFSPALLFSASLSISAVGPLNIKGNEMENKLCYSAFMPQGIFLGVD